MNLMELITKLNCPIIDTSKISTDVIIGRFPFIKEYRNEYEDVDPILLRKYGKIKVNDFSLAEYQALCKSFIVTKANQLKRIYDITYATYDPFENFNTTMEVTEELGATKVTNAYGEKVNGVIHGEKNSSTTYGQITDTNIKGATETTNTYGAQHNTETNPKTIDTITRKVNADDGGVVTESVEESTRNSLVAGGSLETVTDLGTHTDVMSDKSTTDTNTVSEHGDSHKENTYTDTSTDSAHTDIVSGDKVTNKTTTKYSGNQGVSITNQVLVENEVNLWSRLDYYEMVINMFIPFISLGVWE